MFQDQFDQTNEMNAQFVGDNMNVEMNMDVDNNFQGNKMMGGCPRPMVGPVQERVVNRTFVHEVPHVCPIHTKIVNHHIYKHTYRPAYSCHEENVCSNVQCGSCCNFR